MTKARTMLSLAADYLSERRALGFDLRIAGDQIVAFARFVDERGHNGPLTNEIVLNWVQGEAKRASPMSWARRLDVLRPFARYLARLDPATEFPQTAIFGRSHRRLAPHIYSEPEICDLLAAAWRLAPEGGLRPATYATIFGLIAATGLRLSEALHLHCGDLDFDQGSPDGSEHEVPQVPARALARHRYGGAAALPGGSGASWLAHRRLAAVPVPGGQLHPQADDPSGFPEASYRPRLDCTRRP